MKRISLPIIALGLLVSGSPAYAEDDVLKFLFDTDIIDEAHKVASFYSDVNNLWDAGKKVAEFLGWLKADATTADVLKMLSKIDDDIAAMYIGEHNDYVKGKIHDQLDIFRVTFNHLKSGVKLEKGKYDDDDTAKAAGKLLDHQLFLRPKEGKDDGLLKRFNYPCDRPCVYTEATLGLEAGNMIYDWRAGLPPLMLAIAWRVQLIATLYPNFFVDPDADPENYAGYKSELEQYRGALYKHYLTMVNGIRCALSYDECADIHSAYKIATPSGPERWWSHAVHGALPIYEVKALIDTLDRYIRGPEADLTQNYHRLPSVGAGPKASQCLHLKNSERPSLVLQPCDGSSSQEWVYNRVTGTIMNFGTLANPATGECLGVTGGVQTVGARKSQLKVILSKCADPAKPYQRLDLRRQQWTYDPESQVLLNAMGTALSFYFPKYCCEYSVWTEPYSVLNGNFSADDYNFELSFGDSSKVQWHADPIIPGIAPFSDTMGPGETMHKGESRVSRNNRYELILRPNGDLAFYEKLTDTLGLERPHELWSSHTDGKNADRVVMERDGNLVIYPPPARRQTCPPSQICNNSIWQSGTSGHAGSHLKVEGDDNAGFASIYDQSKLIWFRPVSPVCGVACTLGPLK